MGPAELERAARAVADHFGAEFSCVAGERLEKEYPQLHAVGRGAERAPRMVKLAWGDPTRPRVALVGKGVCFDSGGLDLKPSKAMLNMKKDMAGAAQALGLGLMLMDAELPIRLELWLGLCENSVSHKAMRPGDVLTARNGSTTEIGNTDAEGRLVLADLLAAATEQPAALLVDCATLTGARLAALGPDIPAVLSNRPELAEQLEAIGRAEQDPVWPLPLWQGYRGELESKVADLCNVGGTGGGAITAALYLEHFVAGEVPWVHMDFTGWHAKSRPGRPAGGDAAGMRALYELIKTRFG